ncbi:MAG: hypothetical protein ACRBN8_46285 [Nannocystales bacterium]
MVVLANYVLLGLPDLDRLRELLQRIQEILALGGIAFALLGAFTFLLAWVVSFLRKPSSAASDQPNWLARIALGSATVPVGLTLVAGLGALLPMFAPYVLKAFALAVVTAAFSWCVAVAALIKGGDRPSISQARRALLLAGMPWYCLVLYLSTYL